jgi:N-acyl-phosphatidylethanolamine-hydrolysing phospholipase D
VVIISHDHFDHCDLFTLRDLCERFKDTIHLYVPLKLKKWVVKNVKCDHRMVTQLDWWHSVNANTRLTTTVAKVNRKLRNYTTGELEITFLPAQHWSNRTFLDLRHTLWGGWGLKYTPYDASLRHRTIYFAGDTGYDPKLFEEIGKRYSKPNGGVDVGFIPIGAYAPRYYSRCEHIDPAEAFLVALDVDSRHNVAMHWGTFDIAAEALMEPKVKLDQMRRVHSHGRKCVGEYFVAVFPGDTRIAPYDDEPHELEILEDKSMV